MGKDNQWVHGTHNALKVAKDYFEDLFSNQVSFNTDENVHFIRVYGITSLNNNHLEILNKPFTRIEIENALFHMDGYKVPDPNGLPAIFYQKF